MSTLTLSSIAVMPRANLLPPEIAERARFRRVQLGLGGGVLAALLVVAALYMLAMGQVTSAKKDLVGVRQENATLTTRQAGYADVPRVYAQKDEAEARLQTAMGSEVQWSYFLQDLALLMPPHVWLEKVSVVQVDPTTTPVASPLTAATTVLSPGLGLVHFDGESYNYSDIANWLEALSRRTGQRDAYVTTASVVPPTAKDARALVKFSSQVTLTDGTLSGRYLAKGGTTK